MTISELLAQVNSQASSIEFSQVISVIENNYTYAPTKFSNGDLVSEAGTNEGSCKIFYFAQLNQLSEANTLNLFGDYYRTDVLAHPEGNDHGNIRNFMQSGWRGIKFEGNALVGHQ